jgi:uncharacterized membrane protein
MPAVNEDLLLDTVLRPAPALPARALLAILAAVASINVAFALSFILRGAWPVLPFLGIDVALLAWAFRTSARNAEREEHVTLTPSLLKIVRRPERTETALNPYWVRVQIEEQPARLTLWSHGKGVRIGQFLPPEERLSFAERLKSALTQARLRIP